MALASIGTLALMFSTCSHAEIYKWTDEKGTIHYTAIPPMQKKTHIKATNIESEIRSAAGKYRPPARGSKRAGTDRESTSQDDALKDKNEQLAGPDKKLVKYCENQRNNLQQLKKNYRNVWIDVKGQKTTLNQEQRKQKVDYLKQRIQEDCAGVNPK